MPKISPISSTKLTKILVKQGFIQVRQKGSHLRLEHPDGRKISLPIHPGENIGVGLLRKILRDINMTPDQFNKLK